MTPTQRAAAERLVEGPRTSSVLWGRAVIALLRELTAEPAQEPLFWVRLRSDGGYEGPIAHSAIEEVRRQSGAWTPLYTSPQQRTPLSDDALMDIITSVDRSSDDLGPFFDVARAVEKALGIAGAPE
jgi:hypothetical protein